MKSALIQHELYTSELRYKLESLQNSNNKKQQIQIVPDDVSEYVEIEDQRQLNSFSKSESDDCPFMRYVIESLYKNDLNVLRNKSLNHVKEGLVKRNGKTFFREEKEPLTPEKRIIINKIFRNRIESINITNDEELIRKAPQNINRLINWSLKTIRNNLNKNAISLEDYEITD